MADETRDEPRRTWPQRLGIAAVIVGAVACFAAAGVLAAGQWVVSNRNLVVLDAQDVTGDSVVAPDIVTPDGTTPSADPAASTTTPPTFPAAEPEAKNFLITGADNNACVDPDSPFAPAFGDRTNFGERSDTIMVWRVNPSTKQVAILSFPRDLWVTVNGSKNRINAAYRRDDPALLRDTIYANFGVPIDHYVQVDFCAFKRLVDAVGGVAVPFEYPARDDNTGLNVPTTGCFTFDGDHALAYVRSRYYEYEDPPGSGNWKKDPTSDLGRISRQQDFLRRTVATVLRKGTFSPSVISALIDTNREYLTTDDELTPSKMLEFAGVLRSLDPNTIASYQIEASGQRISGNAVLVPRIDGENMRAILAVFRGQATLADAPEQDFAPTTSAAPRPTGAAGDEPGADTSTTAPATVPPGETTTTLPSVVAEENNFGISPPRDVTC